MPATVTIYFNKTALANWLKHLTSGSFDGVASPGNLTVHLYKNGTTWLPNQSIGSLTECDFVGYSAVNPVVWLTPFLDQVAGYTVDSQIMEFTCTATTTPNTVHGFYVTTTADSGQLLFGANFDTPIPIGSVDDAIQLVIRLSMGGNNGILADFQLI